MFKVYSIWTLRKEWVLSNQNAWWNKLSYNGGSLFNVRLEGQRFKQRLLVWGICWKWKTNLNLWWDDASTNDQDIWSVELPQFLDQLRDQRLVSRCQRADPNTVNVGVHRLLGDLHWSLWNRKWDTQWDTRKRVKLGRDRYKFPLFQVSQALTLFINEPHYFTLQGE